MTAILFIPKIPNIPESQLFSYHEQADLSVYFRQIIDLRPVLIVVDASVEDWRLWLTTPKVSPATRRIPILLLSDEATIRAEASLHGADYSLSKTDFLTQPLAYFTEYVRVLEASQRTPRAG